MVVDEGFNEGMVGAELLDVGRDECCNADCDASTCFNDGYRGWNDSYGRKDDAGRAIERDDDIAEHARCLVVAFSNRTWHL